MTEEYATKGAPLYNNYCISVKVATDAVKAQQRAASISFVRARSSTIERTASMDSIISTNDSIKSVPRGGRIENPEKPNDMSLEIFKALTQELSQLRIKISSAFILNIHENVLDISDALKERFLKKFNMGDAHPRIFKNIYISVYRFIEAEFYPQFLELGKRIKEGPPKFILNDIITGNSAPPYSLTEFQEFLKTCQQEEKIHFLKSIIAYGKQAEPLFYCLEFAPPQDQLEHYQNYPPYASKKSHYTNEVLAVLFESQKSDRSLAIEGAVPSSRGVSNKSKGSRDLSEMELLKEEAMAIVDAFLVPGAISEMPVKKKTQETVVRCIKDFTQFHPHVFVAAYCDIAANLNENYVPDFITTQHEFQQMENALLATIPSYTVAQLLNNDIPAPYARKDFVSFCRKDKFARNALDFLNEFREFEKMARILFEDSAVVFLNELVTSNLGDHGEVGVSRFTASPIKPPGMAKSEFVKVEEILKAMAYDLYLKYVVLAASNELALAEECRDHVKKHISADIFHPFVFFEVHLMAEECLQGKLSPFLKATFEEMLQKGIALKISKGTGSRFDLLLQDGLKLPFSYMSFVEYARTQKAEAGLELLRKIVSYVKMAVPLYSDSLTAGNWDTVFYKPKRNSTMSESEFKALETKIDMKYAEIFNDFFITAKDKEKGVGHVRQSHADLSIKTKEKNIEFEIFSPAFLSPTSGVKASIVRQASINDYLKEIDNKVTVKLPKSIGNLLIKAFNENNKHPNIFTRVYNFLSSQFEKKLWEGYSYYLDPTNIYDTIKIEEPDNFDIKQVALNECRSPFTYSDYFEFLKLQHCQENLQFVRDGYICQLLVELVYPNPIIFQKQSPLLSNSHIPPPSQPRDMDDITYCTLLIEHQNRFIDLVETFILENAPSEVNLSVNIRKPFLEMYHLKEFHPELLTPLLDHIVALLKINNFEKFLKRQITQNPTPFPDIFLKSFTETSKQDKIFIEDIIFDRLAPPFSTKDFMRYLTNELCQENLEFIMNFIRYHAKAAPFYASSVIGEFSIPEGMSQIQAEAGKREIRLQCLLLAETYIYTDSPKELNIIGQHRIKLLAAIENSNYNPMAWKDVVESTVTLLQKDKLQKFIKSKCGS